MKTRLLVLFIIFSIVNPKFIFAKSDSTLFEQAFALYKKRQYKQAIEIISNTSSSNQISRAEQLIIKGHVYSDSLGFEEAKKYFLAADSLLIGLNQHKLNCYNYFGLGKVYFNTDDFKTSIKYFLKMESEARSLRLIPEQKSANYYLAVNYQRIFEMPVSNYYIKNYIELSKFLNDSASIFKGYYTYAANYIFYLSESPETFTYSDSIIKVVKLAEKYITKNNYVQMAQIHDLYSKSFAAKNDYQQRKIHSLYCLNYYSKSSDSGNYIGALISAAQAYVEIKKYDSALYYQKRAESAKLTNKSFMSNDQRVTYINFYKIYKGLGKDKLSLEYLEKWKDLDWEINSGKNLEIQQMRADFEKEKTNQHIIDENEKTKVLYEQKQNFYIYLSGAILFILILAALLIHLRYKFKKENENRDLLIMAQNSESSALRAQMNPHFIFNSLIAIQNYVFKHKPEETSGYISRFAKLIRMILENSRKESVSIESEIIFLNHYLELQKLRFPNKFNFTIHVDKAIDVESELIPPMVSQPFIENAVEHGIMNKTEGEGFISVDFILKEGIIKIKIKDNGNGRKPFSNNSIKEVNHESLATKITKDRFDLLNKKTNKHYKMEIVDLINSKGEASGTEVIIDLPTL